MASTFPAAHLTTARCDRESFCCIKQRSTNWTRKLDQKGLTLIPLRIYFREGIAKCELALAQAKKKWDRRQTERDKEAKKEVGEAMRQFRHR